MRNSTSNFLYCSFSYNQTNITLLIVWVFTYKNSIQFRNEFIKISENDVLQPFAVFLEKQFFQLILVNRKQSIQFPRFWTWLGKIEIFLYLKWVLSAYNTKDANSYHHLRNEFSTLLEKGEVKQLEIS